MKHTISFSTKLIFLLFVLSSSLTFSNEFKINNSNQSNFNKIHIIAGSGLLAYFPFNGNINDVSGNNYSIIVNDQIFFAEGKIYLGLASSGLPPDTDQIQLPSLFNTDSFTLSVWIKSEINHGNDYGNTYISIWHSTNQAQRSFILSPSSGNLPIYPQHEYPELLIYNNNNLSFNYGSNQLNEGTWQHLALTSENRNMNVYVDGVLIIENILMDNSVVAQNLNITLRGIDLLDELRLYDRELSQFEILEIIKYSGDLIFESGFEL